MSVIWFTSPFFLPEPNDNTSLISDEYVFFMLAPRKMPHVQIVLYVLPYKHSVTEMGYTDD